MKTMDNAVLSTLRELSALTGHTVSAEPTLREALDLAAVAHVRLSFILSMSQEHARVNA